MSEAEVKQDGVGMIIAKINHVPAGIQYLQKIINQGEYDSWNGQTRIAMVKITPYDIAHVPELAGVDRVYFAYEEKPL
jgi:hypothetical protein